MRNNSYTSYLITREDLDDFPIRHSYSIQIAIQNLAEYRLQLTDSGKAGYTMPTEPVEYLEKCLLLTAEDKYNYGFVSENKL